MASSKQDYEAIAAIISDARARHDESGAARLIRLTGAIGDYFASTNPDFDRNRFVTACLPKDGSIGGRS